MASSFDIALSGLNAAGKRLDVAANNIANQFSTKTQQDGQTTDTPYAPQHVDQVSLSNGGVQALVNATSPATTTGPDSQGNLTQQPNVDPAEQLIQLKLASYDFKANLKTIKAQDDVLQSLLDIKS